MAKGERRDEIIKKTHEKEDVLANHGAIRQDGLQNL